MLQMHRWSQTATENPVSPEPIFPGKHACWKPHGSSGKSPSHAENTSPAHGARLLRFLNLFPL